MTVTLTETVLPELSAIFTLHVPAPTEVTSKVDAEPPCATVATDAFEDEAVQLETPFSLTVTLFVWPAPENVSFVGVTFNGARTSTSTSSPTESIHMFPSGPAATASGRAPALKGGVNDLIVCADVLTRKIVPSSPDAHHGSPSGPRAQNCSVSFEPNTPPTLKVVILPLGVILPSVGAVVRQKNQTLLSFARTTAAGVHDTGMANILIAPVVGLMRPIAFCDDWANQTLPSEPAVTPPY